LQLVLVLQDKSASSAGKLVITAEELHATNNFVTLQFCAKKLDKKDGFLTGGSSDPYMTIASVRGSSEHLVHSTEVVQKSLNPEWRPFTLSVQALCNGDYDRPLKFRVST
jgi:hypothetical protein